MGLPSDARRTLSVGELWLMHPAHMQQLLMHPAHMPQLLTHPAHMPQLLTHLAHMLQLLTHPARMPQLMIIAKLATMHHEDPCLCPAGQAAGACMAGMSACARSCCCVRAHLAPARRAGHGGHQLLHAQGRDVRGATHWPAQHVRQVLLPPALPLRTPREHRKGPPHKGALRVALLARPRPSPATEPWETLAATAAAAAAAAIAAAQQAA